MAERKRGTLALSWGLYGGFYVHRHRVCLGWIALTYVPDYEVDDLMAITLAADAVVRNLRDRHLVDDWCERVPTRAVANLVNAVRGDRQKVSA